eukprot:89995-Chlamydomonas_euryale.AAC.5
MWVEPAVTCAQRGRPAQGRMGMPERGHGAPRHTEAGSHLAPSHQRVPGHPDCAALLIIERERRLPRPARRTAVGGPRCA